MPKLYFEDFSVGDVVEYGDTPVTAEEIKAFAGEFDPQPMHLDDEAAKRSIVGGLCASGWHTCALMMRILFDGFLANSSSMGAPGVEEIRWLVPVRARRQAARAHPCAGEARTEKPPGFRLCPNEI